MRRRNVPSNACSLALLTLVVVACTSTAPAPTPSRTVESVAPAAPPLATFRPSQGAAPALSPDALARRLAPRARRAAAHGATRGATYIEPWTTEVFLDPADYPSGDLPPHGGLAPGQIALTFDDGPSPQNTRAVLDILDEYGVKATFFVTGHRCRKSPELVREIIERGHTLATHTYKHRFLSRISKKSADLQVANGYIAARNAAGPLADSVSPFFRFPGGRWNADPEHYEFLADHGMLNFHWNLDSHDTSVHKRAADQVAAADPPLNGAQRQKLYREMLLDFVIHSLHDRKARGILLMHDTRAWTRRALPALLDELRQPERTADLARRFGFKRFTLVVFRPTPDARSPLDFSDVPDTL